MIHQNLYKAFNEGFVQVFVDSSPTKPKAID